jgi:hypothetical protein
MYCWVLKAGQPRLQLRSGEAIAATYIPENLERDTIFFNKQFFSPRNMTSTLIRAAAAAADLQVGPHRMAFKLGPVVVEQYVASRSHG